jgi:hypothetical protein
VSGEMLGRERRVVYVLFDVCCGGLSVRFRSCDLRIPPRHRGIKLWLCNEVCRIEGCRLMSSERNGSPGNKLAKCGPARSLCE